MPQKAATTTQQTFKKNNNQMWLCGWTLCVCVCGLPWLACANRNWICVCTAARCEREVDCAAAGTVSWRRLGKGISHSPHSILHTTTLHCSHLPLATDSFEALQASFLLWMAKLLLPLWHMVIIALCCSYYRENYPSKVVCPLCRHLQDLLLVVCTTNRSGAVFIGCPRRVARNTER